MSRFIEANERIPAHRNKVEAQLRKIQILLAKPSRWGSVSAVASSLRNILTIARFWLRMRELVIAYTKDLGTMSDYCRDSIEPFTHYNNLRVGVWGSGWNKTTAPAHTIKSDELVPSFPDTIELQQCESAIRESESLLRQVDTFYAQTLQLWNELPEYSDIKPVCPIGGRQALSGMQLVYRGTASTTKPSQNELYGFSDDFEQIGQQLLRCTKELDGSQHEKKGKAPSWAAGCRINRWKREAKYETKEQNLTMRLYQFRRYVSGYVIGDCITLPSMAKLARKIGYKTLAKRMRVVYAIVGRESGIFRNNVETILTSRPNSIGGDDYVATAVWVEEYTNKTTPIYRKKRRTVSGYVYFRKHWPDCFHSVTELTSAEAHAQLDTSSDYWFRYYADEKLRHESRRKYLASTLRQLRRLPCLTIQDSFACGNCRVGTLQFLSSIGYQNGDSMAGRKLAKVWRKANYAQQERFAPVVIAAENRVKQTVDSFYAWAIENN